MGNLALSSACDCLQQGKLVAYPTEAVWGIGCDPYNEAAVTKILTIKQRPVDKGLILVAAEIAQISDLVEDLSEVQLRLLTESWPGPITWLIPDPKNLYPAWIKGSHNSVAIRVSAHPLVKMLCLKFGKPIVSTSANQAGEEEIRTKHVLEAQFADKIDYILDGELGDQSSPSQIKDLVSGKTLR